MNDPSNFDQAYFIQTRKEIESEKHERDVLLNFAILVLGAVGFGLFQSSTAQQFIREPMSLAVEIPALTIISTLFWVRYQKLKQISERWFSLSYLSKTLFDQQKINFMLETIVTKSLTTWRYIRKDFLLNISFSLPFYGLLLVQVIDGIIQAQWWRIVIAFSVFLLHIITCSFLFSRKFRDPFEMVNYQKDAIGI